MVQAHDLVNTTNNSDHTFFSIILSIITKTNRKRWNKKMVAQCEVTQPLRTKNQFIGKTKMKKKKLK